MAMSEAARIDRIPLWSRLLAFKMAYLGAAAGIVAWWPDMDFEMMWRALQRWPREGDPVFGSHFATWDGAHYLFLSEVGYVAGASSCAFYPLWRFVNFRWAG
jgi:hypothetical protein